MPRANRHFLPGQLWHITHRCHEKSYLNMVRTGVVWHPAAWADGGYREIQDPPRRYALIQLEELPIPSR